MSPGPVDCGNGIRLDRKVSCRMPDGVVLYSDHYYPAGDKPFPTLLMRQPYGRDIASTVVYAHPLWFARHGYHVVIQDVRGRGDSEGDFYPFRHERSDGAATIRWLLEHPFCNGRIGMYGFSYQGMTQLLAAAEQPPGLICIAPGMTAHDLYHGWFYHQGALRLASTLGWGLQMLRADARRRKLEEASDRLETAWNNLRNQPLFAPYEMLPALRSNGLPTYVRDWLTHTEASEYWAGLDISQCVSAIQVPALHVAGWFDTYLEGSVAGFLALSRCAQTEFAREHQYLVAGPWIHIPWGDMAGESSFGLEALLDTDSLLLRWFNHWLKNSGEFESESKVRHFALGVNRWYTSDTWSTETRISLYLHSDGRANSRKGDGLLNETKPEFEEPRDVFVYDPEVPVHAPGGPQALSGSYNQALLELGNNLLVYTTQPLTEDLHIFGHPTVTLYATTSASFADLTAKLVRDRPDGTADFLCIGIARSSWLHRHTGYVADTVRCWEFTLEPTSCVLFAGERLRLEIASSAFPLYDRNPSTSIPPSRADNWNWQRSTQQILHDTKYPSALHLPILEPQA